MGHWLLWTGVLYHGSRVQVLVQCWIVSILHPTVEEHYRSNTNPRYDDNITMDHQRHDMMISTQAVVFSFIFITIFDPLRVLLH